MCGRYRSSGIRLVPGALCVLRRVSFHHLVDPERRGEPERQKTTAHSAVRPCRFPIEASTLPFAFPESMYSPQLGQPAASFALFSCVLRLSRTTADAGIDTIRFLF